MQSRDNNNLYVKNLSKKLKLIPTPGPKLNIIRQTCIVKKRSFNVSCNRLLITTKELEKIFGNFFRHLNNMFLMILSKILNW